MAREPVSTKPLIDKLGVKPGMRVSLLGVGDAGFLRDLSSRTLASMQGQPQKDSELIIVLADAPADLKQIAGLKRFLTQNGGLWVIYPKGRTEITERQVREAGLAAGLVDNKVVSFSASHTGLRFVIPVSQRIKT